MFNIDEFIDACESMKINDYYVDPPHEIALYLNHSIGIEGILNKNKDSNSEGLLKKIVGWIMKIIDNFKIWWGKFKERFNSKKKMQQEFQSEKEVYNATMSALNKEITELKDKLNAAKDSNNKLQSSNDNLRKSNEDLKLKNRDLQRSQEINDQQHRSEKQDLLDNSDKIAKSVEYLSSEIKRLEEEKKLINEEANKRAHNNVANKMQMITDIIMNIKQDYNRFYDIVDEIMYDDTHKIIDEINNYERIIKRINDNIDVIKTYIEKDLNIKNDKDHYIATTSEEFRNMKFLKSYMRNVVVGIDRNTRANIVFAQYINTEIIPTLDKVSKVLSSRTSLVQKETQLLSKFVSVSNAIINLNYQLSNLT